jgi:hypothetical protein
MSQIIETYEQNFPCLKYLPSLLLKTGFQAYILALLFCFGLNFSLSIEKPITVNQLYESSFRTI